MLGGWEELRDMGGNCWGGSSCSEPMVEPRTGGRTAHTDTSAQCRPERRSGRDGRCRGFLLGLEFLESESAPVRKVDGACLSRQTSERVRK